MQHEWKGSGVQTSGAVEPAGGSGGRTEWARREVLKRVTAAGGLPKSLRVGAVADCAIQPPGLEHVRNRHTAHAEHDGLANDF